MNLKYKQWIDGVIGRALVSVNVLIVRGIGKLVSRNHQLTIHPDHILVIKMLGLGSVLMAMDSLNALKKKYPNTKIILMCGKGVAAGIEPLHFFDAIWVHNDNNVFQLVGSGIKLLIRSWKLKKLWVIDLEVYSVLTTLFSAWTTAINRFGFQLNKVNFRNYLNTHNIYFNQFVSVQENYLALVQAMGVLEAIPYQIQLEKPKSVLHKQTIAINNTCSELGGNLRKLEAVQLIHMIEHLIANYPYNVLLTGAPSDANENERLIQLLSDTAKQRTQNIAGKYSFKAYYTLLKFECIAMITIDSAPLHIASKLGLPILSFWGPINPIQRIKKSNQSKHHFVYLNKACSPCIHLTDIVPCMGNNTCMKDFSTEFIKQELDVFLNSILHD
jgi:ADP-heptose:LPS heptosyltransferase